MIVTLLVVAIVSAGVTRYVRGIRPDHKPRALRLISTAAPRPELGVPCTSRRHVGEPITIYRNGQPRAYLVCSVCAGAWPPEPTRVPGPGMPRSG